jgi:NAD(P)-dependent dehydrogenase (short-subunit alcohol dehydrogenase family)
VNESEQDLTGKTYVVTGANSGIGQEAAEDFARRGAQVALVCRSQERGRHALESIRQRSGNPHVRLFIAEFSCLSSVAAVSHELLAAYPVIDVLCNNAGGANGRRQVTDEGFEKTFVTNHLSSFLLTRQLLPGLLAAAKQDDARVVFTSSLGHKNSPLDFDNLNLEKDYSTLKAYGRSKLMNLLTARELQRRYGEQGIIASSFHPGAVRTAIWGKGGLLAATLGMVMYPFMRSVEKGADTLIWLASSRDADARQANGHYYFDRRRPGIAEFASDDDAARLWQVSEELVAPYSGETAQL